MNFKKIYFPISDSEFSYVDMHVHSEYSNTDCRMKVEKIISIAKKLGIGIAITDHNQIGGAIKGAQIAKKEKVLFIPGVEVHTANGTHVVFYFWEVKELIKFYKIIILPNKVGDPFERIRLTFSELLDCKRQFNCLVSLPHPFVKAFVGLRTVREKNFWGKVDLIEGINSFIRRKANEKAMMVAKEKQITMIAGTDAHFSFEIGRSLTIVRGKNIYDFMKSLQNNKTEVIGKELNFIIMLILSAIKETRYLFYCIQNKIFIARLKGLIQTFLPYFNKNRKFEIPLYIKKNDK
ncbi:PHP domain-containing protein [Candidatus Parcubacteria bacterium]|nr:PHP domain-containing protein [Candidatus Parcubacteria bacterium]